MKYTLKRYARSRSIKLRVDNDGNVVATAPKFTPKKIVDLMVQKNQPWIKRQLKRLDLSQSSYPTIDWKSMTVSFLGRIYPIKINIDQDKLVELSDQILSINPPHTNPSTLKKTVVNWLKQQGRKEITKKTLLWSQKMDINYKKLRFAQQKSRWGSCSTTGTISFNWRLIHFDQKIIDYVIIHELSHVVHPNHSKQFYSLINQYSPDYKNHIKFLKSQRVRLE